MPSGKRKPKDPGVARLVSEAKRSGLSVSSVGVNLAALSGSSVVAGRSVADALADDATVIGGSWQPLPEGVSEAEWQTRVVDFAEANGWQVYHTHSSIGSQKGFPDLVMVRVPTVAYAELKREDGTATPEQVVWADKLRRSGQVVYLWRPSHWPVVQQVLGR